jgi:uncharacterized protein YehS (DUF1456 family)
VRAVKIKDEEMARVASEQKFEAMRPEFSAKLRVSYRNPWRYTIEISTKGRAKKNEADFKLSVNRCTIRAGIIA